ncbi:amino acid ABC transporter ATP-binding protein [Clostridium sp. OS1-26]|uniref:amino acid ABC transporter ATP-binding protein n=1 Tax=Clostridium sp. OS1-26 TaxID=3070681 RepID=UPI0027E08F39|nr:amino acid ABC transporter ATP-binding protein [Clostridium sp. OS1-26]WML32842.1 amino acid ABC transporter ATP-binding protein [Clostridium sp. OS1-26]
MIQIRGLQKQFGSDQVLKGIDLTIKDGEVVGIIGPSGSGKSTLLRCIDFLEKPNKGHIQVDDFSMNVENPKKKDILYLRRNTAMVFQQFNLFKQKTSMENVMEGLVTVQKISKEKAYETAQNFLKKVGLGDRMDYYPRQLSGGQQQRVSIARALALNPKVILFDEPTSALDPEMVGEVLEVIKEAAKEGRTMIIVSHEMSFVREIADKVVFFDNGAIVEQGTPDEVFLHTKNERTKQFLSRFSKSFVYNI